MTDAHFHRSGDTMASVNGMEFRFAGVHPWNAEDIDAAETVARLRSRLELDASLGVGEIGLDRLMVKAVPSAQRELFAMQLELAAEMGRPVVLHGAKCWGEVVKAVNPYAGRIPSFLFHGFSRSEGLLPDIVRLNGFVGVGKAVLNDHAVNYRQLVKRLPHDRLLVETDCPYLAPEPFRGKLNSSEKLFQYPVKNGTRLTINKTLTLRKHSSPKKRIYYASTMAGLEDIGGSPRCWTIVILIFYRHFFEFTISNLFQPKRTFSYRFYTHLYAILNSTS